MTATVPEPDLLAAAPAPVPGGLASSSRPQALYFGAPACFGWFHAASGVERGDPVLLCAPLGSEDLAAHASLRLLAGRLAAAGLSCLRFDGPGHGDSAPGADDAGDRLACWTAGIGQAIDALKRCTGARAVQLVGLRLGASLAAVAAAARDDVSAFVAVAPVISGRHLLREWKLLAQAGVPVETADGGLEAGGFVYDGATCAALRALDLLRLDGRPAPRALVIDRADFPLAAGWAEVLRRQGVDLRHEALPGYEGLLAVAHLSTVPEGILATVVDWLQPGGEAGVPVRGPRVLPDPVPRLRGGSPTAGWVETPAWWPLAPSRGVAPAFGVLVQPEAAVTGSPARGHGPLAGWGVLVLNTGAERRIGPHGLYPSLQREWAGLGATSLRLDLAGLGDSPAPPGEPQQQVYPSCARAQLVDALAGLRRQPGVERVAVLGLCSGAFQAFRAAVEGVPMDAAVVINPLMFFFDPQVSLAVPVRGAADVMRDPGLREAAVQQLSARLWRTLADPAAWRKLVGGQADVRFIAGLLARRAALAAERAGRRLRRRLGLPVAQDVVAELDRAAALGVRLHFVFASGDPGLALLQAQAGGAVERHRRRGHLSLTVLCDADHTLTTAAAREQLRRVLPALLGAGRAPP